jgi:tripartite-type tricarboxylate transporter receptor subunit TctC
LPQIQSGKMIPLALAAPERSPMMPQVPTFAEQGVPNFSAEVWYGFLAPAGAPQNAVAALEREAAAFAKDPAVRDRLVKAGIEPVSTCGQAFASELASEVATYSRVAKSLNLKVE